MRRYEFRFRPFFFSLSSNSTSATYIFENIFRFIIQLFLRDVAGFVHAEWDSKYDSNTRIFPARVNNSRCYYASREILT